MRKLWFRKIKQVAQTEGQSGQSQTVTSRLCNAFSESPRRRQERHPNIRDSQMCTRVHRQRHTGPHVTFCKAATAPQPQRRKQVRPPQHPCLTAARPGHLPSPPPRPPGWLALQLPLAPHTSSLIVCFTTTVCAALTHQPEQRLKTKSQTVP